MLIIQHSEKTTAHPADVWKVYENVSGWPRWNDLFTFARLDGPFAQDTKGKMKLKSGSELNFTITYFNPLHSFTTTSPLRLATLIFNYVIISYDDHTMITHRVEIKGILGFFYALLMRNNIKKNFSIAIKKLVILAERNMVK